MPLGRFRVCGGRRSDRLACMLVLCAGKVLHVCVGSNTNYACVWVVLSLLWRPMAASLYTSLRLVSRGKGLRPSVAADAPCATHAWVEAVMTTRAAWLPCAIQLAKAWDGGGAMRMAVRQTCARGYALVSRVTAQARRKRTSQERKRARRCTLVGLASRLFKFMFPCVIARRCVPLTASTVASNIFALAPNFLLLCARTRLPLIR